MPIVIGAREDAQDGRIRPTMSPFTTSLEGSIGSTADIDGALQRSMGPFRSRFQDRSWPQNGWAMYGGYQISFQELQFIDEPGGVPNKTWNEEKDIMVIQGLGWRSDSLMEAAATRFQQFKENNPNSKLLYYWIASEPTKPSELGGGIVGYNDETYELINDETRGNTGWYLTDENGNLVESRFDATRFHRADCYAQQLQPVNSFNRTFVEQWIFEHYVSFIQQRPDGRLLDYLDGVFWDVVPPLPEPVFLDGSNGNTSDSADYNRDGAITSLDSRGNETIPANPDDEDAYGAARIHRRGAVTWIPEMESAFSPAFSFWRNGTEDGIRFDAGDVSTAYNQYEFLERWGGSIHERMENDLGTSQNGTDYDVDFDGIETAIERHLRIRKCIKPPSEHEWGPFGSYACMVVIDMCTRRDPATEITQIDHEYARFYAGISAIMGACFGPRMRFNRYAWPRPDEYMYVWGDPVDSDYPERMGTVDLTTAGAPVTLRAYDYNSGGVQAWWQEFDNVLWIVRADAPSTGTGNFGTGSAASITLPSAGSGNKWIFPDFSSYTNPNTGWTARNQSPAIYDGSDAGSSIDMTPWTARMLARVPS